MKKAIKDPAIQLQIPLSSPSVRESFKIMKQGQLAKGSEHWPEGDGYTFDQWCVDTFGYGYQDLARRQELDRHFLLIDRDEPYIKNIERVLLFDMSRLASIDPIVSPLATHHNAVLHGWYDGQEVNIPEKLALIHSEASEALEAFRKGKMDYTGPGTGCFGEELADVVIRVFDLAEHLEIDMMRAVKEKHEYNIARPFRHGGKAC